LAGWLRRSSEAAAPPPKAPGAEQGNQNHTDDRHPDGPANRQFGNQEEDDQQNYAGDYGDRCEAHLNSGQWSVISEQWSVISDQKRRFPVFMFVVSGH
jgi:hypothetical protein